MLEIIRRGPAPEDPNLWHPEGRMDLEEATAALLKVVESHENGLPEAPTIDTVVGLPRETLAEAATTIAISILGGTDPNNFHKSRSDSKRTEVGHMMLELEYSNPRNIPEEEPKSRSLSLVIFNPNSQERIIGTRFPLVHETDPYHLMSYYYSNPEEGEFVDLVNRGSTEPLDKAQRQKIRRGTRWLFANMLNWSGKPLFPADLDLPELSEAKNFQINQQ